MRWERYVGPASALVAAAATGAARMPFAALTALLLGIWWYRADRRYRAGTAGICFFAICLLAILPLTGDGVTRILGGLAVAGSIAGYAASRARAATRGADGAVDETVRRRAVEAAGLAFPAVAGALLIAAGRVEIGFWGVFLVAIIALGGLSALVRKIR